MSTEMLPPYSGEEPTCPKCLNVGARTQYLAHGRCVHGSGGGIVGVIPNERLHRKCWRCDYAWDEAVVAPAGEKAQT